MKEIEEFYSEYYAQIYAFCLSMTKNRADAEDLAAETFYRAIYGRAKFRGESKVSVWLCSIARNLFLTWEKKRKRPLPLPDPPKEHQDLEDKESATEILFYMNKLDEPYRGVFLLRVVGESDYAEIARIYQKSESWARVTYHRAKLKILKKMEDDDE